MPIVSLLTDHPEALQPFARLGKGLDGPIYVPPEPKTRSAGFLGFIRVLIDVMSGWPDVTVTPEEIVRSGVFNDKEVIDDKWIACGCGCHHGLVVDLTVAEYSTDLDCGTCHTEYVECSGCGSVIRVFDRGPNAYWTFSAELLKYEAIYSSEVVDKLNRAPEDVI